GVDSLKMGARSKERLDFEGNRGASISCFHCQSIFARARCGADADIHKQVGRILVNEDIRSTDCGIKRADLCSCQITAAHQEPDWVDRMSGPPEWRLDLGDEGSGLNGLKRLCRLMCGRSPTFRKL